MKNHRSRGVLRTVASVAAAVSLSAGAASMAGATPTGHLQAHKRHVTTVTIGIGAPVAEMMLPYYAQMYGFFGGEGINAKLSIVPGTPLFDAISGGKVDFASFGGPQPAIGDNEGDNLKYYMMWVNTEDLQFLVAPGIKTARQLKGAKIGVTAIGSTTQLLTTYILTKVYRLPPGSFTLVPLGSPPQLNAAFLAGEVSAIMSGPPSTQVILGQEPGAKVLYDLATSRNFHNLWPEAGLLAQSSFAKSHPRLMVKMDEALIRAARSYVTHPAKVEHMLEVELHLTNTGELKNAWSAGAALINAKDPLATAQAEANVYRVVKATQPGANMSNVPPRDVFDNTYVKKALTALAKAKH